MTQYRIPAENMPLLTRRVEQLQKKAAKLRTSPIVFTVVGSETKEYANTVTGVKQVRRYELVEVSGETPVINGWALVGVIQHLGEAGNVLRALPEAQVPERFRSASPDWCDHCRTTRTRRDTYVLKSADDYKQVGSSCLRDFTDTTDPEAVAKWHELVLLALDAAGEYENDGGSFRARLETEVNDFLAVTAAVVRERGWTAASAARYGDAVATKTRVSHLLWTTKNQCAAADLRSHRACSDHTDIDVTDADKQLAAETLEWVRGWDHELNDYEHNLYVACSLTSVSDRLEGIVASAIAAYRRMKTERREREVKAESKHLGAVGERLTLEVEVTNTRFIESDWGGSHLVNMLDADGNRLKWFASSGVVDEGRRYKVTGTVKKHDEYKGTRETVLTRCKVQEVA